MPLLLNLHGYGSNNIEQELYSNFRPIADTANFIIAHPNGTFAAPNIRFWNTFGGATVDDVGFLSKLIDTISAGYNINQNRIYSTGMSNGGFMSYDLACMLSHRITAVASVTGSMIWPRLGTCSPLHPFPVMQIHGTADATVPYNGNMLFAHIDTLVNYWVLYNNCLPVPTVIPIPDINPLDGCTATRYIFSGGNLGCTVELFKVQGGGHSWPGAPINLNTTCMDFSASREIWRFLRQYRMDGLMGGIDNQVTQNQDFTIFPNPSHGDISLSFTDNLPKEIKITNSLGQVVYKTHLDGNKFNIQLNSKGLHFVKLLVGDLSQTKKVMIL